MWMNITYWLKSGAQGRCRASRRTRPIKLEIYDAQGQLVRTLSSVVKPNRYTHGRCRIEPEEEAKPELTTDAGLNRVQWDLRYEGAKRLPNAKIDSGDPDDGPLVLPGDYTLKLNVDGKTYTASRRSAGRSALARCSLESCSRTSPSRCKARAALERLTDDIEEVRAIRAQTQDPRSRTRRRFRPRRRCTSAAERVVKRCDVLESRMHNPEAEVVYDVLAGREGRRQAVFADLAVCSATCSPRTMRRRRASWSRWERTWRICSRSRRSCTRCAAEDLAGLEAQAKALDLPRVILPDRSE